MTTHLTNVPRSHCITYTFAGTLQLRWLSDENIKQLLKELITKHVAKSRMTDKTPLTLSWLQDVWKVMVKHGIDKFADLRTLPILTHGNWESEYEIDLVPMASNNLLLREHPSYGNIAPAACEALQLLGISIVDSLPEWINMELVQKYINMPSPEGIKDILGNIAKSDKTQYAIERFNGKCTETSRQQFTACLSECSKFDQATLHFLSQLRMFCAVQEKKTDSGVPQSVGTVMLYIDESVHNQFPEGVNYPTVYLNINATEERIVQQFSCRKVSLLEIVKKTLERLVENDDKDEVSTFMTFFVMKFGLFENDEVIVQKAKSVQFIKVGNVKRKAGDVFDPLDKTLARLFVGEKVFPETNKSKLLIVLRRLGMKSVDDITGDDLFRVGKKLDSWVRNGKETELVRDKASAFLSFLSENPKYIASKCGDGSLKAHLEELQCIPYCQMIPSGVKYPNLLKWYNHISPLCKPSEVTLLENWYLVGSTMPLIENDSQELIRNFGWKKHPPLEKIMTQLKAIVAVDFDSEERSEFVVLLKNIYMTLADRQQETDTLKEEFDRCELTWTGEGFKAPKSVILKSKTTDVDARPYLYFLPQDFNSDTLHTFFRRMGCLEQQGVNLLRAVIHLIEKKYKANNSYLPGIVNTDRHIVNSILNKLADMKRIGASDIVRDSIKIMVESSEEERIVFALARECVYDDDPQGEFDYSEIDNFVYIHKTVDIKTAKTLGVTSITEQCFMEAEEVGLQEWGQNETLTVRISALLRDDYSDGLAVPKELIQNADDAGANTVKFLYDERENTEQSKRLFTKKLAECHGPSLWVYNDSEFRQKDFENITKLNGATKSTDSTTIGKFGLGFCSVYNITDVPSIISGSYMVVFDPNEYYLKDARATKGLKVNLTNRKIVKLHEDQFKPIENVFGCNVLDKNFDGFRGTLFRLPLRTAKQANESKISQKAYTDVEIRSLLELLIEDAGNFLMFTQHVSVIELYHLPQTAKSPSEAVLWFSLNREKQELQNTNSSIYLNKRTSSILSQFTTMAKERKEGSLVQSIKLTRNICPVLQQRLNVSQPTAITEKTWIITWSMLLQDDDDVTREVGVLPLAAVAVPTNEVMPLKDGEADNLVDGHVFCFMPLPIPSGLQFHINGCFSVTSNRRNLFLSSKDNKDNSLAEWNRLILARPLTQAFITHLLHSRFKLNGINDCMGYYKVWPLHSANEIRAFEESFYKAIVTNNQPVFSGIGCRVGFEELVCLDETFAKDDDIRDLAFEVLSSLPIRGGKQIVVIPNQVMTLLKKYNANNITIIEGVEISKEEFFLHCLMNINSEIWLNKEDKRDLLVLKMLQSDHKSIQKHIQETACIATRPTGKLRSISDLIHPRTELASMFDELDEVFPSLTFQDDATLRRLEKLGMSHKTLTDKLLLGRLASIRSLIPRCGACTLDRIVQTVNYINSHIFTFERSSSFAEQLKDSLLLPMLERPESWNFQWKLDHVDFDVFDVSEKICSKHVHVPFQRLRLAKPKYLYKHALKHCFGSVSCILDEMRLSGAIEAIFERRCYEWLCKDNTITFDMALQQLEVVSDENVNGVPPKAVLDVYNDVIEYMRKHIKDWSCRDSTLLERLKSKPIIPMGDKLVKPEKVAFKVEKECENHLYWLGNVADYKRKLFKVLGVRERFSSDHILNILMEKWEAYRDNVCEEIEIISSLLHNLQYCMKTENITYEHLQKDKKEMLVVPDLNGRLFASYKLALDDKDFTIFSLKTVHASIAPDTAQFLGVTPKKVKMVEECSDIIPFGQQEELPTRLKGLLEDYPCDESIIKELIQNADDAGATEVHFIKFFSTVNVTSSLGDGQQLQPALCVFNDSYFRDEDFEGIRNLGIGSKGQDPTKTGKYGLGFNAVYHLTDEPSFVSKGPNLGESGTLCIFDPLFKSIGEYTKHKSPGIKVNVEKIEAALPDLLKGYPTFEGGVGTMFRFPLRQEKSGISSNVFHATKINELIDNFLSNMHESLHFLKSVSSLKVYSYTNETYVEEYCVTAKLTNSDKSKRDTFFKSIKDLVAKSSMHENGLKYPPFDVGYTININDSRGMASKWYIANRFGGQANTEDNTTHELETAMKNQALKLLPLAGVSVELHGENLTNVGESLDSFRIALMKTQTNIEKCVCKAFCLLPLPEITGLPFHVNGNFAVDRARRGLIKQGIEQTWNNYLIKEVLFESIVSAFKYLQWYLVEQAPTMLRRQCTEDILKVYHSYFPTSYSAKASYWKFLTEAFYTTTVTRHTALFPFICHSTEYATAQQSDVSVRWLDISTQRKHFESGIFNCLCRYKNDRGIDHTVVQTIQQILKSMGMLIIETPVKIQCELVNAGCKDAVESDPEQVLAFLKTGVLQSGCSVENTHIVDASGARNLLKFCMLSETFCDQVKGVPLCLTNDLVLREFTPNRTIYCATECKLLKGSSDTFLHKDLVLDVMSSKLIEKGYFRKLTVDDFCKLLPNTYSTEIYRSGEYNKWKFDGCADTFIKPEIVSGIFSFLYHQSINGKTGYVDKNVFRRNLQVIGEWSFLPSVDSTGHTKTFSLIPIKDAHFLHSVGHAGGGLEQILKRLNMPALDESVFQPRPYGPNRVTKALESVMCSTDNPGELLKCLVHYKCSLNTGQMKPDEAESILLYMCQHLNAMKTEQTASLEHMLKSLPLYETCDGNIRSIETFNCVILLPDGMPIAGLQSWDQIGTQFLKNNEALLSLYVHLGIKKEPSANVYADTILPRVSRLGEQHLMEHVMFIKSSVLKHYTDAYLDEKQREIVSALKRLPFVRQGQSRVTVSSLFSNEHPVFKVMEEQLRFVPPDLNNKGWMPFLCLLDLNTKPTGAMMVRYAQDIARAASLGTSTAALREKSAVVCTCLFGESWDSSTLSQLKHVEFVVPHAIDEKAMLIVRPKCYRKVFVSFHESVGKKWHDLCWSSMNLLKHSPSSHTLCSQLGILAEPPVDKVLTHCQSICEVFVKRLKDRSRPLETTNVLHFMEKVYKFLDEKLQEYQGSKRNAFVEKLKERLITTCFVYIENTSMTTMMTVSQVFTAGSIDQEVLPYLLKVPKVLQRYYQMFETIGALETPTPASYVTVLATLKTKFEDNRLPKSELLRAAKAIRLLLESLFKKEPIPSGLATDSIYLPDKDGVLTRSSELTVADNKAYAETLSQKCSLKLFIGFQELDIIVHFDPYQVLKKLPQGHRPRILSDDVSKNVCMDTVQRIESVSANRLQTFLRSTCFQNAVCRLLRNKAESKSTFKYDETDEINVKANLSNVTVSQVRGLQTRLSYRGKIIDGTTENKVAFIKDTSQDIKPFGQHAYTLYFQLEESEGLQLCISRLLREHDGLEKLVRLCTNKRTGSDSVVTIQRLFKYINRPTEMSRYLDKIGIKPHGDEFSFNMSVFPDPGTYVEEMFHPFMVQDIVPFEEHEFTYLAMELENTSEDDEDSSMYIYANIILELPNKTPTQNLTIRYLVEVGKRSREPLEVPIYKLFKFLPQNKTSGQELQVCNIQTTTGKPFDANCREILKELKEAMNYSEDSKKSVVKRLLKKWHPDRNMHQQEYAARVFNFIMEALIKLERKEGATIVINDRTGRAAPDMSLSSWGNITASVERKSKIIAQAYRNNIEEYQSSGLSGKFVHVVSQKRVTHSLKEANIWLKQAKEDFVFAQSTLRKTCPDVKGFHWICFMCHQVSMCLTVVIMCGHLGYVYTIRKPAISLF